MSLEDRWGNTRVNFRKLHSKRVEKMRIYTRNEWRRCKTTLVTSGEDQTWVEAQKLNIASLASNLEAKSKTDLQSKIDTSSSDISTALGILEGEKLHSKRVGKMWNYTRNEWREWRSTLRTSEEDGDLSEVRTSGEYPELHSF